MRFQHRIRGAVTAVGILLLLAPSSSLVYGQTGPAQDVPTLVEVYWQSSKIVPVPGISNVIVLDTDITRAETGYDSIQFFGLERGETVALGYIGDKPISIRVRVVQRPMAVL